MHLNAKLTESAGGPRSPLVRGALLQAGAKHRVEGLKKLLISAGSCAITCDDVGKYGLKVLTKKFSFCGNALVYAFVDRELFANFTPIINSVDLRATLIKNGIVGIRRPASGGAGRRK